MARVMACRIHHVDLLFQLGQLLVGDGLAVLCRFVHAGLRLAPGRHGRGQLHLLIGGEQRHLADLLQVHADGVIDVEAVHQRIGVDQLLLLDLGDLLHGGLAVLVGQIRQEILCAHLDAQRLQRVVDGVHLVAVQIHLVQHLGQLAGVQTALLLALDEQLLQLFVGSQQRGGGQGGDGLVIQLVLAGHGGLIVRLLGGLGVLRRFFAIRGLLGLVLRQQGVGHLLQLPGGVLFVSHVRFPP